MTQKRRIPTAAAVLLILLGVLLLAGGSCAGLIGLLSASSGSNGIFILLGGLAVLGAGVAAIVFAVRRM